MKDLDDQIEAQNKQLLLVFANICKTKALPKKLRTLPDDAPSAVTLPSPPAAIGQLVENMNALILKKYSSFVRQYAATRAAELGSAGEQLPGTTGLTAADTPAAPPPAAAGTVAAVLSESHIPTSARSPFLAVSGHGDDFTTIGDLVGSLRDGTFRKFEWIVAFRSCASKSCGVGADAMMLRVTDTVPLLPILRNIP